VHAPLSRAELVRLGSGYWLIVGIATLFTLARFSEAFLLLRAQSVGLALALVPLMLVVMNAAYALSAWPAGALSDRVGRFGLLAGGLGVLVLADLVLAFAAGAGAVLLGVVLWGLHMGLTQGLLSALVADTAPAELRGTAFGVFNLVTGVAMLVASVMAGALWDLVGPQATFVAGALMTALTLLALPFARRMLH
jgi:MFS family permease